MAKARRAPQQRRARQTVEAVLDAVERVLKRDGVDAVTTNRIAEAAGVSVGSVYQYFPDKRAIFAAVHDRHAAEVARALERALVDHADAPRDERLRALVEAMIDAHRGDPRLYALLSTELPHGAAGADGLHARLRGALRLALADGPPAPARDLERTLFVLTHMIDALAHGAVLRRPARLSLAAAREEAVRAVLAYVHA